jgi:hypothetical protein
MSYEKLIEYGKNFDAFMTQARKFDATSAVAPGQEGEWSPAFVMHHIADYEMHFAIRYFNALTIDRPPMIPFAEDLYPTVLNYEGRDWVNSLALIDSIGKLVQAVLSPLSSQQWERLSVHPEAGEVTVSFLIGKACSHMAAHTEQLKGLM